jgi:3-deoxy-D-manno-octulosonate 8-phosphate phosphatase KdsC-like HAD superfamily phosphatase
MRRRPIIASPWWTAEEDNRLRALAEDGRSVAVIAERLKRSSSAVRKRAKKLGVMVELRLKAKK